MDSYDLSSSDPVPAPLPSKVYVNYVKGSSFIAYMYNIRINSVSIIMLYTLTRHKQNSALYFSM